MMRREKLTLPTSLKRAEAIGTGHKFFDYCSRYFANCSQRDKGGEPREGSAHDAIGAEVRLLAQ